MVDIAFGMFCNSLQHSMGSNKKHWYYSKSKYQQDSAEPELALTKQEQWWCLHLRAEQATIGCSGNSSASRSSFRKCTISSCIFSLKSSRIFAFQKILVLEELAGMMKTRVKGTSAKFGSQVL